MLYAISGPWIGIPVSEFTAILLQRSLLSTSQTTLLLDVRTLHGWEVDSWRILIFSRPLNFAAFLYFPVMLGYLQLGRHFLQATSGFLKGIRWAQGWEVNFGERGRSVGDRFVLSPQLCQASYLLVHSLGRGSNLQEDLNIFEFLKQNAQPQP